MRLSKRLQRYVDGLKKGTGDIDRRVLILTLERFLEDSKPQRRPPR